MIKFLGGTRGKKNPPELLEPQPGEFTRMSTRAGMKIVYPDDTFIVGFPKSGTNWMRFLLANMTHPDEQISFRNLNRFAPDLHNKEFTDDILRPRYIKTHYAKYEQFPRFVYICRDGRDIMVSYYHYAVQKKQFNGSFSKFLHWIHRHCYYGTWQAHVDGVLDFQQAHPERVLFVRYEDMLQDPVAGAEKIAQFCGLALTQEQVADAAGKCKFEKLKKNEEENGSIPTRKEWFTFFRSGTAGQWGDMFSHGDMQYFLKINGEAMRRAGYKTD